VARGRAAPERTPRLGGVLAIATGFVAGLLVARREA
jgi:hypothetical protein